MLVKALGNINSGQYVAGNILEVEDSVAKCLIEAGAAEAVIVEQEIKEQPAITTPIELPVEPVKLVMEDIAQTIPSEEQQPVLLDSSVVVPTPLVEQPAILNDPIPVTIDQIANDPQIH